jgi:hypothetical protein
MCPSTDRVVWWWMRTPARLDVRMFGKLTYAPIWHALVAQLRSPRCMYVYVRPVCRTGCFLTVSRTASCQLITTPSLSFPPLFQRTGYLAGFNRFSFVLPVGLDSCGWAGLAELPGSQTWYSTDSFVSSTAAKYGR